MQLDTIIELIGLIFIILAHLVLIVSRFQKHENRLSSIQNQLNELKDNQTRLSENTKILHNIEGQLQMMIQFH